MKARSTRSIREYDPCPEEKQAAWVDYRDKENYDALKNNKLTEENFHIAYQITFLLSNLIAKYNIFILSPTYEKRFNISYGLHENVDEKHILLDISGEKNESFKKNMDTLINSIENDIHGTKNDEKKSYILKLKAILTKHHLSISLVTSTSHVYSGEKSCSEITFYKELEKYGQGLKSVAHFYVTLNKKARPKNESIVTFLWPQPSCTSCKNHFREQGIVRTNSTTKRTRGIFNDSHYTTTTPTNILKNITYTEAKASKNNIEIIKAPLNNKNLGIFNSSVSELMTDSKEQEIPNIGSALKDLSLAVNRLSKKI